MRVTELPVSGSCLQNVPEAELIRLLGYPKHERMTEAVAAGLRIAKDRFSSKARPRVFLETCEDGIVAAITSGRQIESEVARLWRDERIDEAYLLDRVSVAVVETLVRATPARLAELGVSVLPHRSPGNEDWSLAAQHELYDRFETPLEIDLLSSGMLSPVASMLALYPFAPDESNDEQHFSTSTPCATCRSRRCPYRRAA